MGSKMEIEILPLWDRSTFEDGQATLPEPAVYMRKINFMKDTMSEDYNLIESNNQNPKKNTTMPRFSLVQLRTINACADGQSRPNHIVLNRAQGRILSALPGDTKISQIAVEVVFPWILGEEEPEYLHVSFERRHWPLVFSYAKFDAPPVYSENFSEAMLCGLRSFLGPNFYLLKFADFLADKAFTFALPSDRTYEAAVNIFGSFEED
jgi:hypothetical protein